MTHECMVDECIETQTMQDEDEEMAAALDDEEGDGMRLASTALEANTGGCRGAVCLGWLGVATGQGCSRQKSAPGCRHGIARH